MFGLGLNRSLRSRTPTSEASAVAGCFHCGLALPAPVPEWLVFAGAPRPMCCVSCLAAARLIVEAGLGAAYYYDRLGAMAAATTAAPGDA